MNPPLLFAVLILVATSLMSATVEHEIPIDGKAMVTAHHKARQASGVKAPLEWSDELAAGALAHARRCEFAHSDTELGENLFSRMGDPAATIEHVVAKWDAEKADYNAKELTCKSGEECGHYTQIVWCKTRAVGCGAVRCDDGWENWVCRYEPAGNFGGESPFDCSAE